MSEINKILDSHFSRVNYQKKKKAIKQKTQYLLKNISKKNEEHISNPFQGVQFKTNEEGFVQIEEKKEFVPVQHIAPIQEPIKPIPKTPTEKDQLLKSKFHSLLEQKNRLSKVVRDLEEKEAALKVMEMNLRKKEQEITHLQKQAHLDEVEKAIDTIADNTALVGKQSDIEIEIATVEERLQQLKQKELNKLMKLQVFTKNQIAEFVDYVKNFIALEEFDKALTFHEIAQNMFLSTKLPKKDEIRLKEILKEQFKKIKLEMMKKDL